MEPLRRNAAHYLHIFQDAFKLTPLLSIPTVCTAHTSADKKPPSMSIDKTDLSWR